MQKLLLDPKKPNNFPGGSAPLAPRQGLCPWTPLGAAPPDPCRTSLGGASAASVGPLPRTGTARFTRQLKSEPTGGF